MSKVSKFAKNVFQTYPILANSLVYGTLYVGAEFSQQTVTRKLMTDTPTKYDPHVIGKYAVFGTLGAGPFLTLWYRWLDKKFVGKSATIIVKKLILDQFLMTPHLLVIFYVAMSLMEHKKDLLEECKQKFVPTFKSSCMFWLPAQTFNFIMVPPALRVVYVGSCSFAWVNILCWIKRQQY